MSLALYYIHPLPCFQASIFALHLWGRTGRIQATSRRSLACFFFFFDSGFCMDWIVNGDETLVCSVLVWRT